MPENAAQVTRSESAPDAGWGAGERVLQGINSLLLVATMLLAGHTALTMTYAVFRWLPGIERMYEDMNLDLPLLTLWLLEYSWVLVGVSVVPVVLAPIVWKMTRCGRLPLVTPALLAMATLVCAVGLDFCVLFVACLPLLTGTWSLQ